MAQYRTGQDRTLRQQNVAISQGYNLLDIVGGSYLAISNT
jgi:hypothetical protein